MYFPYFRGRQNELLALRELVNNELLSESILPIIEPISISSTLMLTIEAFINKQKRIGIVFNPSVGNLCSRNLAEFQDNERFYKLVNSSLLLKTVLLDGNNIDEECEYNIAILKNKDNLQKYFILTEKINFTYLLIPDESSIRRKITKETILLEDHFNKATKNSEYLKKEDEFFSDDIFYYKEEKYKGFGDYSIIGDEFSTSGFAPYAIAIHIIYLSDKELRIHHFVSDSNNGIENPAGKYYEAVQKLTIWAKTKNIDKTMGLSFFMKSYANETYHGLGIIKKYSIMHHLELISKILERTKTNELL
ncbi:MAG: sce7725 family protein [Pleomorphochaeta sp.]